MDWSGLAFVANPQNVPLTMLPPWIRALAIQVAWGTQAQDLGDFVQQCEGRYYLFAWAWCQGEDVEAEAELHARLAEGYVGFIANMEEPYDAHGNQADPRWSMPERYLDSLLWDGYLGVTTTPKFGSGMTAWQQEGAVYMPQAFPLENFVEIDDAVDHGLAWGWPIEQQRPLVQCYTTNGQRPNGGVMNEQATGRGVGIVPYVIEQAMDPDGMHWLEQTRQAVEAPTVFGQPPEPEPPEPEPEPEPDMELIGSQHGINAMCDFWRELWPEKTKPDRNPNDLGTWGAIDKLERTLEILALDHDEALDARRSGAYV